MEFKGSEKVITLKLQFLWRDFDSLEMKESESVRDFSSRVAEIVNQIKGCGDTIADKKVVEKVLRSLPQKFDHAVAAIEESKDLSKMSMSELTGSLQAHEKRINRFSSQPMEQAFQSKFRISDRNFTKPDQGKNGNSFQRRPNFQNGKGRKDQRGGQNKWKERRGNMQQNSGNSNSQCFICKRTNHESKDCRLKCTKCRIPNHSQRDCWYQNKSDKNEANFTKESEEEFLFFSCMNAECEPHNLWYLDSSCSNYMLGNIDIFVELNNNYSSQVKFGDENLQCVEGKCVISVQTQKGIERYISYVLYVPNLTQNLLSVGQLLRKGYSVYFDNDKCEIVDKKNNIIVAKINMSSNKVFPLELPLEENFAFKSEQSNLSYLWHLRYGHLNSKGVRLLKQKNMVVGLPSIDGEGKICEGCIFGKMHRLPFPKTSWRAKAPLELVHADICGPTRTPSLNNKRYFILFVDDYTRMMWLYFLNAKSEAFSIFNSKP